MISGFKITHDDWQRTPQPVRIAAVSLQHQLYLLNARFNSHQQQLAATQTKATKLERRTEAQAAEIESLKLEVTALKERLGQNSTNSNLPPSSDSAFSKQQSTHESSGRKAGAQLGHRGVGRKLLPVEQVDQIVELRPESCAACGALLLGIDWAAVRRQVSEIINGRAFVTEYRQHRIECLSCGVINREGWSAETSSGAFGANVTAITAYLTGRLHLSHRDTVEALDSLFKLKIGLGSIAALQRRISSSLAHPVAEALEFVKQQSTQYVDETSWQEKDKGKWLWVNSTHNVTVFQLRDGRSQINAHAIIDSLELGIVTTDRYPGYSFLQAWRRQLCWAHLKRDFTAIAERNDPELKECGNQLLAQTKKVFEQYHKVRDGTLEHCRLRLVIEPIKKRIREILESGAKLKNSKTALTCRNMLKHFRSLWTFVRVKEVEPTNNRAERALRRAVLWRRKSFGTQSEAGSRFVERILSVVTTLRQQGRSVLDYLQKADLATNILRRKKILDPNYERRELPTIFSL